MKKIIAFYKALIIISIAYAVFVSVPTVVGGILGTWIFMLLIPTIRGVI